MSRKKSFEQISIDVKYKNQKSFMKIFCSPCWKKKILRSPFLSPKIMCSPQIPGAPLVVINDTSLSDLPTAGSLSYSFQELNKSMVESYSKPVFLQTPGNDLRLLIIINLYFQGTVFRGDRYR